MKEVFLKMLDIVNTHFKFIVVVAILLCVGFISYLSNDQILQIVLTLVEKIK